MSGEGGREGERERSETSRVCRIKLIEGKMESSLERLLPRIGVSRIVLSPSNLVRVFLRPSTREELLVFDLLWRAQRKGRKVGGKSWGRGRGASGSGLRIRRIRGDIERGSFHALKQAGGMTTRGNEEGEGWFAQREGWKWLVSRTVEAVLFPSLFTRSATSASYVAEI